MITLQLYHLTKLLVKLTVCDRVSLVEGDAGSGKTFCCSLAEKAFSGDPDYAYKISGGGTLRVITSPTALRDAQQLTKDTVYLIDEEALEYVGSSYMELLTKMISVTNSYFIIFSRVQTKLLTDVRSVYTLKWCEGLLRNVRSLYPPLYTQSLHIGQQVLCEDTESGYHALVTAGLQPVTTEGKDGVIPRVDNTGQVVFLDFDQGSEVVKELSSAMAIGKVNPSFIDMTCFEEIIANSLYSPKSLVKVAAEDIHHFSAEDRHRGIWYLNRVRELFRDHQDRPLWSKNWKAVKYYYQTLTLNKLFANKFAYLAPSDVDKEVAATDEEDP